jgi:hypothetical protein
MEIDDFQLSVIYTKNKPSLLRGLFKNGLDSSILTLH